MIYKNFVINMAPGATTQTKSTFVDLNKKPLQKGFACVAVIYNHQIVE